MSDAEERPERPEEEPGEEKEWPESFWEIFGGLSADFERPEQRAPTHEDIGDLTEDQVAEGQLALILELRDIPGWEDLP